VRRIVTLFLFLIIASVSFAEHLETLKTLSDQSLGGNCDYFEDVSENNYWLQWRVDNPPSSSAITLNQVSFYGDASGTYNAGFSLASNTFMFEGYWGGRRMIIQNGVGLEMMQHGGAYISGPACPDGSASWVVFIFCPANTPAQNNSDPFGWGGTCKRNNHRGFQCKDHGEIYLSTGLWESQ